MTRFTFLPMLFGAAALLVTGCASTSGTRSEPSSTAATAAANEPGTSSQGTAQGQGTMGQGQGMMGHGMMAGDVCPMQVEGTKVTTTDVEGGVALDFKTTGDVAALRQRVQRMADMHDQHHGRMGNPSGGGRMGGGMGMMPASTSNVENIDGGARLVLRPTDPAQLDTLRDQARMRANRMASGQCPMMSGAQGAVTLPPRTDRHGQDARQAAASAPRG